MSIKNHFLSLLTMCSIASHSIAISTQSLYEQLHPEILKRIDIENPSEAESHLITACQLLNNHGTPLKEVKEENWQAITSIEMFTEVLPRLQNTLTLFGHLSLAQQCAQLTTDVSILNKRINLTKYFEQNPHIFAKINHIVSHVADAEKKFLDLCKPLSEEEQEAQKKVNKKLYHTCYGLDKDIINENSWLLGFWTRLDQLVTTSYATIPSLIGSYIHADKQAVGKIVDLIGLHQRKMQGAFFFGEDYLEQEIAAIRKEIADNPSAFQLAFDEIKKQAEAIETNKRNKIEKIIAKCNNLIDIAPIIAAAQEEENKKDFQNYHNSFLKKYFKHATNIGIKNIPSFYKDAIISIASWIKTQFTDAPIYNTIKSNLLLNNYEDSLQTKLIATGWTTAAYAVIGGTAALYPVTLYLKFKSTKEIFDLVLEKQHGLIQVGFLIKSLERVHQILQKNPELATLVPEYAKLAELFDTESTHTSSELKFLVQSLLSNSFQGEDSYFFSQQGKILAVHHLFMRIHGELIPYLQAFGNIDAYLSTFKLYQTYKNHQNAKMCLVNFVEHDTPQLAAQGFWHPIIGADNVITNDIVMGHEHGRANLIITGPNAGGKTTSLMSLIINIIMAQSFGIAPSSALTITPFTKIHSYLDITTNLIEGESLFKAEANRAKKLKASINACTPGEKTFTIIDEIFSGTAPDVASKVGFQFAEQLGNLEHSMAIITTHFPRLTDLEEETNHYQNYKVADAHISEDGTITYPFKLIPGKSTQNIAQHILEHEDII